MTHICVSKQTIIGSDYGLSPSRSQAIIWTNAGILLIGTLGTNTSEILSKINAFSYKKMHLKMSSGKWRPFCRGLNVFMYYCEHQIAVRRQRLIKSYSQQGEYGNTIRSHICLPRIPIIKRPIRADIIRYGWSILLSTGRSWYYWVDKGKHVIAKLHSACILLCRGDMFSHKTML